MAIASLAVLVIVHKLEYFLNARIAGLIAAPSYYAYLKDELAARGLI